MTTIKELISNSAWKSKEAFVIPEDETSFSYSELLTLIDGVGGALLKDFKLQAHHKVGLLAPNGLECAVSLLAVTSARMACLSLNPQYSKDELLHYLGDGGAALLLVHHSVPLGPPQEAARQLAIPLVRIRRDGRALQLQVMSSQSQPTKPMTISATIASLTVGEDDALRPRPSDVAFVFHTSGTTSKPKGVPLRHSNVATTMRNVARCYGLNPADRSYVVMPLFHVHGLIGALLATLASGGTVVVPNKFSASLFWNHFNQFRCTWYSAVPTIHQIMLAQVFPGAPSLRFIRSCSSSLAPALLLRLEALTRVPVVEAYAMTECAHQVSSNMLPPGQRKAGSVGKAVGCEIAIFDAQGQELKQGAKGEVCIRGQNVTSGYLDRPEENTKAFLSNGFFRTGDEGFFDQDGYLFLTGRIKELINRGGEKISPVELDSVLLSHPKVKAAICFGVPDSIYGEEIHAAVVLTEPPVNSAAEANIRQELLEHVKKQVAAFKVPKKLYIAESLPSTATGKIQRRFVAEHFVKLASKL